MRKLATLVVLIVSALLTLTVPAHAKGITEATFTGPGLPLGGITVRIGEDGPVGSTGQQAMEWLSWRIFDGYRLDAAPVPKTALGPRYEVEVAFDPAPQPIRVDLYPYAADAPALYIPAGQRLGPEFEVPSLPAGWTTTGDTFLDTLIDLGFPRSAPKTDATPAPDILPREPQGAPSSSWWLGWPLVVGVLPVLLAASMLLRSRRHASGV